MQLAYTVELTVVALWEVFMCGCLVKETGTWGELRE